MSETIQQIQELKNKLQQTGELLKLTQKKQKILEYEDLMIEKDFWDDNQKATQVSQELSDLKNEVEEFEVLEKNTKDLLELSKENEDFEIIEEELKKIKKDFSKLEFKTMLSGEHDENNAIIAIHAGAGGTDAQDWAEILERMLFRFCESKNWKVNILDRQSGAEAGIKSVMFEVVGKHAFGYLQSEAGVHRLVRISPFDAEKMRHTSFALIEVLPELKEMEEVELKDEDLKVDTFRASGKGGQGVNTTDSAVRITHLPSGIVVTCQNERSQLQNKETALKVLRSRLKKFNEAELEEEKKELRGEFSEAAWGNQIRSYVLHPYKMVKDHRTEFETQDVEKVLDGELGEFMEEYLKYKISNK